MYQAALPATLRPAQMARPPLAGCALPPTSARAAAGTVAAAAAGHVLPAAAAALRGPPPAAAGQRGAAARRGPAAPPGVRLQRPPRRAAARARRTGQAGAGPPGPEETVDGGRAGLNRYPGTLWERSTAVVANQVVAFHLGPHLRARPLQKLFSCIVNGGEFYFVSQYKNNVYHVYLC